MHPYQHVSPNTSVFIKMGMGPWGRLSVSKKNHWSTKKGTKTKVARDKTSLQNNQKPSFFQQLLTSVKSAKCCFCCVVPSSFFLSSWFTLRRWWNAFCAATMLFVFSDLHTCGKDQFQGNVTIFFCMQVDITVKIMHLPITSLVWELGALEGGTDFILFLCVSCFYNTIICKPVFLYFILSLQFTAVEVETQFDSDWKICLLDFNKKFVYLYSSQKTLKHWLSPDRFYF